jgi:mono/diheme cytochrome c family protein
VLNTRAIWPALTILGLAAFLALSPARADGPKPNDDKIQWPNPYDGHIQCEEKNCKIDLWLTRGFRAFSQCQVCHGLDANGSSFAPSLVEKLQEIDQGRFFQVVVNGFKGQIGVMPAWAANPNVMNYIDSLYAYLKARSDGVLPAGKLQRYDR